MRSLAFVLALLLTLTATATATDYYVNNVSGDDGNNGLSPRSSGGGVGPVQTIERALQLAEKGDTVILANTNRPYRECITLQGGRHSGLDQLPFHIKGNGAVIDGSTRVPDHAWDFVRDGIFRFHTAAREYFNIFYQDRPMKRRWPKQGRFPDLKPLEWTLVDQFVYVRTVDNKAARQLDIRYAFHPTGITLYQVKNVLISDLTVQGFRLDGVNAHDSVFGCTLSYLVLRGNGRSGVSIGGSSRVFVEATLAGNNGAAQLRTEGHSVTRVLNSDLVETKRAPAIVRRGGEVTVTETVDLSDR